MGLVTAVGLLDKKLRAAGVPIHGIADLGNSVYRIDFKDEATQPQRDQAAAIIAAFDPNEVATKEAEVGQANPTAAGYFASKPAAIAFIRLTPAEQEAQIEGMTLAQLKTVVKYLAVAVSALVKRELL